MSAGAKIVIAFLAGAFILWLFMKATCIKKIDKSGSTSSTQERIIGTGGACSSTWTDSAGVKHTCNGYQKVAYPSGLTYCDCGDLSRYI